MIVRGARAGLTVGLVTLSLAAILEWVLASRVRLPRPEAATQLDEEFNASLWKMFHELRRITEGTDGL